MKSRFIKFRFRNSYNSYIARTGYISHFSNSQKKAIESWLVESFWFKGATKVVFVSTTKIGKNTTNILKLLFFIINLLFVLSNQLSTYQKLILHLTSSVYFVFFPLEMLNRLKQTKVYHTFSHFVWKETTHKPLKLVAARTLFSSVYVVFTACFDECFLFFVIPERHCFSRKFSVALRSF